MTERIDQLVYASTARRSTVEGRESNLYATNPAEYLVSVIATDLKTREPWPTLFGSYIDAYERMDYPVRSLPAMRVYLENWTKNFESWFVDGKIAIDVIWPPAIRRRELTRLPSMIAGALMQQFRSLTFFRDVYTVVPGLNELGKSVDANLSMGFKWKDDVVPLTQVLMNFRIDLRDWDDYLTSDNRTKDQPFDRTLGDLRTIVGTINGVSDEAPTPVDITIGWSINAPEPPPPEVVFFGFAGGPNPETIGGFNEGVFAGE